MSGNAITLQQGLLMDDNRNQNQTVNSKLGKQGRLFLSGAISIFSGGVCLDHTDKYNTLFIVGVSSMALGVILLVIGCHCPNKSRESPREDASADYLCT